MENCRKRNITYSAFHDSHKPKTQDKAVDISEHSECQCKTKIVSVKYTKQLEANFQSNLEGWIGSYKLHDVATTLSIQCANVKNMYTG